jgi:hypothetical protein
MARVASTDAAGSSGIREVTINGQSIEVPADFSFSDEADDGSAFTEPATGITDDDEADDDVDVLLEDEDDDDEEDVDLILDDEDDEEDEEQAPPPVSKKQQLRERDLALGRQGHWDQISPRFRAKIASDLGPQYEAAFEAWDGSRVAFAQEQARNEAIQLHMQQQQAIEAQRAATQRLFQDWANLDAYEFEEKRAKDPRGAAAFLQAVAEHEERANPTNQALEEAILAVWGQAYSRPGIQANPSLKAKFAPTPANMSRYAGNWQGLLSAVDEMNQAEAAQMAQSMFQQWAQQYSSRSTEEQEQRQYQERRNRVPRGDGIPSAGPGRGPTKAQLRDPDFLEKQSPEVIDRWLNKGLFN